MPSNSRLRRMRPVALAAAALTALGLAAALDTTAAGASTQHYLAARSACNQPADAAFHCFATKLVPVAAGTPGAVPSTRVSASGHGYGGGMSPGDLATFYGYNRNGGAGQTVAIIMWGNNPYIRSDLNTFKHYNHLQAETSSSFRVVNQNGATSPLPNSSNRLTGTHGEISLDVEAVRATCGKCKILLVEASVDRFGQPSDSGLATAIHTAVRMGAGVISNSWGGAEGSVPTTGVLAKAFREPGVVVTASTGDAGWYGWDYAEQRAQGDNGASFPSTSPYVVSVGGTTIRRNSDGSRAGETVWDGDGVSTDRKTGGASGGGCSTKFAAPYWQRATPGFSSAGCGTHRLDADIAVDGDPATGLSVYSRSEGGWGRYGGTSLSSPLVAGMYALAGGAGGSAYPAASLYVNVYRAHKATARYDVTSGGNGFCGGDSTQVCSAAVLGRTGTHNNPNSLYSHTLADCSYPHSGANVSATSTPSLSRQCNAAGGFDGPSGIGTPHGLAMFHNTSPGAHLSAPGALTHGHRGTFSASLYLRYGASIRSITWSYGDGSSRNNAPARVTHTYHSKGRYAVSFVATDSFGQSVVRTQYVTVR